MTPRYDSSAPYANPDYVNDNIHSKIDINQALRFIEDVKALSRYLKKNPKSAAAALILFALGYFIWPFDAVPDVIPLAGYLDDAAIIASTVATLGGALDAYRS